MNLSVSLFGKLIDMLLPPECISCRAPVEQAGHLCPSCWGQLKFITDPLCVQCGIPFGLDHPTPSFGGYLCGDCQRRPKTYDKARAALVYNDMSRPLILGYKHGDHTEYAPYFARLLSQAGLDLLAEADMIIPVPLHYIRLFRRRYNQAALMISHLDSVYQHKMRNDLIRRQKHTAPQAGNATKRVANVRGAFEVAAGKRTELKGKNILLVDDVLTTGATVENCAKILKRHGAETVNVLTLARVVRAS